MVFASLNNDASSARLSVDSNVPEVLNVYINEIYKKLTKITQSKLKLKKVIFKIIFVHMNVQNFWHIR